MPGLHGFTLLATRLLTYSFIFRAILCTFLQKYMKCAALIFFARY